MISNIDSLTHQNYQKAEAFHRLPIVIKHGSQNYPFLDYRKKPTKWIPRFRQWKRESFLHIDAFLIAFLLSDSAQFGDILSQ